MIDWQLIAVLLVIPVALWYVGRATWRSLSARKSCGGCGCSAPAAQPPAPDRLISIDEITSRLKK
jgi:hypothetical protein